MSREQANLFFQVVARQRYERGSRLIHLSSSLEVPERKFRLSSSVRPRELRTIAIHDGCELDFVRHSQLRADQWRAISRRCVRDERGCLKDRKMS
jgi:hypothetical protein